MNYFTKLGYRIYQKVLFVAQAFLPINEPKLITGNDAFNRLIETLKAAHHTQLFILTQKNLTELPEYKQLLESFAKASIAYHVFDQTESNPTIGQINEAARIYQEHHLTSLLAIGGGSVIDLAKGVGAVIARPNKSLQRMKGILKVSKKIPPLYAVPTTAGTGSEATLACVVTDETTAHKYAINDPVLIPKVAVLLPSITQSMPPMITASTGMDALTHAVEAYLGKANTLKTKRYALSSIQRIFTYLPIAYQEPKNLKAREEMLLASYEAGVAFTKAYVGNVHAIAHTLGGQYHVPHGLANAVILPHVLEYYNHRIEHKLAKLSQMLNLPSSSNNHHDQAQAFIEAIKSMNRTFDIPQTFDGIIQSKDLDTLIERAYKEANPLYPVPVIFDRLDFRRIYSRLMD